MMRSILSTSSFLVTFLAALCAADNGLYIQNNCGYTIYVDDVCGSNSDWQSIPSHGTVSLPYPGSNGAESECSAKITPNGDLSNILQFEYSWGVDGNLWWDISAQDGDPFPNNWKGVATGGGSSGSASCPSGISCPPGDDSCAFVGRNPDGPTYYCTPQTSIYMWIC